MARTKEEAREYARQYYLKHREEILKKDKERQAKLRAEKLEYYLAHKEEIEAEKARIKEERRRHKLELMRIYQKEHRSELNAKRREWYKRNPEHSKRANKKWYEKNRKKETICS